MNNTARQINVEGGETKQSSQQVNGRSLVPAGGEVKNMTKKEKEKTSGRASIQSKTNRLVLLRQDVFIYLFFYPSAAFKEKAQTIPFFPLSVAW